MGCSAGMAALGRMAPDSTVDEFSPELWADGLRLFPRTWLGPHWDALDTYVPGLVAHIDASVPADELLIGVDEQTAVVGDGTRWQVIGAGSVHVRDGASWQKLAAGEPLTVDALRT